MSSKTHVHALMSEIGPILDLEEITEFDEENLWTLVVDRDTIFFADYEDRQKKLVLSVNIGQPKETDRLALYGLLLQFNFLWQDTKGLKMALAGPSGDVVLMSDLCVVDLEITEFKKAVEAFIGAMTAWREIVSRGVSEQADPVKQAIAEKELISRSIRV